MKLGTMVKIIKGQYKHMIGMLINKKDNLYEVELPRHQGTTITTKLPQSYVREWGVV